VIRRVVTIVGLVLVAALAVLGRHLPHGTQAQPRLRGTLAFSAPCAMASVTSASDTVPWKSVARESRPDAISDKVFALVPAPSTRKCPAMVPE